MTDEHTPSAPGRSRAEQIAAIRAAGRAWGDGVVLPGQETIVSRLLADAPETWQQWAEESAASPDEVPDWLVAIRALAGVFRYEYHRRLAERYLTDSKISAAAAAEADRAATVEDVRECLTRSDGTLAPSIEEWLGAQLDAASHSTLAVGMGLERLASEEAEARFEEERQRLESEAEAERARTAVLEKKLESVQLDRLFVPQPIVGRFRNGRRESLRKRVQSGKLAAKAEDVATLDMAIQQVNGREFADLTVPQLRALVAACSYHAEEYEDGAQVARAPEIQDTPWTEFCRRAGVNPRQPKQARDLLSAAIDVADRRAFFDFVGIGPDGKDQLSIVDTSVYAMVPRWRVDGFTPAQRQDLSRQWADWRRTRFDGKREPWSGPMPHALTLTFPQIIRQLRGALVLSRDLLERLQRGAQKVRGGKLHPLDFGLLFEVTFTRQEQQFEVFGDADNPIGGSFYSYVDRVALIKDYLGEEQWKHNPKRCVAEYERAVQVHLEGGLLLGHESNHRVKGGKGGVKDRMLPNPDVVLGLSKRAIGAARAQQRVLGSGTPPPKA